VTYAVKSNVSATRRKRSRDFRRDGGMMPMNILGICGSPVRDSNTELLLKEGLKSIDQEEVKSEIFTLHGKKIQDCIQCNWCMFKQTEGTYCSIKDDMEELFPKVLEADALLVASPVYLGRLSAHLASVLDRLRSLYHGKYYGNILKHKVGAAMAVSWHRNAGIETTLHSIHWAFHTFRMVVSVPHTVATYGASALSSLSGTGDFDPKDKHQVLKDELGLKTAREAATSLLELTRIIKAGKDALNSSS